MNLIFIVYQKLTVMGWIVFPKKVLHMVPVNIILFENWVLGFSGGAVVKSPPANAGDTGSSPGPGGSHMSQSN